MALNILFMAKKKSYLALKEQLRSDVASLAAASLGRQGELSLEDVLRLKAAVSPLYGVITQAVAIEFVRQMGELGIIPAQVAKESIDDLAHQSPYSNGYDVHIQDGERTLLVAEVKVNEPVSSKAFGAAQQRALLDDLKGLADPAAKHKCKPITNGDYCRFLVLLNGSDAEGFEAAVGGLIDDAREQGVHNVKRYGGETTPCGNTVYVYTLERQFDI